MSSFFCFSCVESGSAGFVEACGKFSRVAHPGLNIINPFCCEEVAGTLSLRVQQLDVSVETITADKVSVVIVVSVQYQVNPDRLQVVPDSLQDAFYKLTDPRTQMKAYVFDVVRATVPKITLDALFEAKQEIAGEVKSELLKAMSSFGFMILQALVTDIDPAQLVKDSMNDINAAERMRHATLERAEADKVTRVKAAEAEADAKILQGQGIARQRQAILGGLRDSVNEFQGDVDGVTPKSIMELLITVQYFDMVKDVGGGDKSSTLFLTHTPAAVQNVGRQLQQAMQNGGTSIMPPGSSSVAPRPAAGMAR